MTGKENLLRELCEMNLTMTKWFVERVVKFPSLSVCLEQLLQVAFVHDRSLSYSSFVKVHVPCVIAPE
jgi:hypothetical protein